MALCHSRCEGRPCVPVHVPSAPYCVPAPPPHCHTELPSSGGCEMRQRRGMRQRLPSTSCHLHSSSGPPTNTIFTPGIAFKIQWHTTLNRPRFQLQFYSHICMCITFLDWLDTLAVKRGNGFVFLAVISYVENLSACWSCFCVLVLRIMFSARTGSRLWECCTEKLPSHLQTGAVDQNKILDSCWESR